MSLLKTVGKVFKPVVRAVAAYYTAGASEALIAARKAAKVGQMTTGGTVSMYGGILPAAAEGGTLWGSILRGIGGMAAGTTVTRAIPGAGAVVAAGGAVGRGVMSAARAANEWCRRQPAWCVTVGGVPAIMQMISSGQLPMPRRRRRRGLSPRDLRGFYKTSRLMRKVAGTIGLRRGGGGRGKAGASTMITQN